MLKLRETCGDVVILRVRTAARHCRTASSNVLSVAMCCIEVLDGVAATSFRSLKDDPKKK